jgi:hypothetical protein
VRERNRQKLGVDVDPELVGEHTCSVTASAIRWPRDQMSATLRPLYSRNSSVPCESVTTFAWWGRL